MHCSSLKNEEGARKGTLSIACFIIALSKGVFQKAIVNSLFFFLGQFTTAGKDLFLEVLEGDNVHLGTCIHF